MYCISTCARVVADISHKTSSAQTYASYPYDEYPSLSLVHGALYGNATYGNVAVAGTPSPGGEVTFITPPQGPQVDQVFCAVVRLARSYPPALFPVI